MESTVIEPPKHLQLTLKRAADDPSQYSKEYQDGISRLLAVFKSQGIQFSAPFFTMDAVDAVGGLTGHIEVMAGSIGPVVITAIGAWLASKNGRKLRVKVGDIEAEANTTEEVEKLLARALEIKQQTETSKIIER